ncbi:hypothetical protein Syun_004862 [Stephania yunnanensis]|uniref:RPB5 homolog n=1 Tax=Stephania yunnanensis TaxID=152371 RepID=A0AAP0Q1T7_9MAGN
MEVRMECMCEWGVDEGSVESKRYYLCRMTTLEMLRDRGYDVPDSDLSLTLQNFRDSFGPKPDLERLRISLPLLSDPSKSILVVFCGADTLKLSVVRNVIAQINDNHALHRVILVRQGTITSQARQALTTLPRVKIELFQITDLLVNVTKHVLMPKHEVLSLAEKEKLLKKYSLDDKQIPRMLETDALARYYGLEKGQVLKITSVGDVVSPHVTYRCVM